MKWYNLIRDVNTKKCELYLSCPVTGRIRSFISGHVLMSKR